MLSIKNLSKVYPGGKKAVDDISLDIQSGEFVAFIGTRVVVVKQLLYV